VKRGGERGCCARESLTERQEREDDAEAAAWEDARASALRVAELRRLAADPRAGCRGAAARARILLALPNCSLPTALYQLPIFGFLAFCVYYLILFGVYQGREVVASFVGAWLLSQAISSFLVFPLTLALILQLQLSVIPAWTPLVRFRSIPPHTHRSTPATVRNPLQPPPPLPLPPPPTHPTPLPSHSSSGCPSLAPTSQRAAL
jgi:hypothetical protein